MPLLKRIEKRISRKEREEELGITELKRKMKEMNEDGDDSDSDSDSSTDSDDSDDSDDDSDDDDGGVPLSDEEDSSSDEDDDVEQEDEGLEADNTAEADVVEEDEALPLESVLEDPIYSLVEDEEPEAVAAEDVLEGQEATNPVGPMGCMLCPNKILKNEKMVEVHLASKPHKRSAARFAKKIADPTFDRSKVMDPRDISIQIEEEIRAGSSAVPAASTNSATTSEPKGKKQDRSVSSISGEQSELPKEDQAKPKRQRAWKEAKREAKRRRKETKETGKPPRKEAERQNKGKSDLAAGKASSETAEKQAAVNQGVETESRRKDRKKGKVSKS